MTSHAEQPAISLPADETSAQAEEQQPVAGTPDDCPGRPPFLSQAECSRRVTLLAELQSALAERGVDSVLARRHRLVLRSGRVCASSGVTDLELHIYAADGQAVATTDGSMYSFANGTQCRADSSGRRAAADLIDLRSHWGEAYEISCAQQAWTARFVAGTAVLAASSASELRELIRQDYFGRKALQRSAEAYGPGERALRSLIDKGVI